MPDSPAVARPAPLIALGPGMCADLGAGASREWLLTDGLGGYAMGTACGLRTRRYHSLLTVATRDGVPAGPGEPVAQRHLALASLDAVVVIGDTRIRLATHEWAGGAVDPRGADLLAAVEIRPGSVAHTWVAGDVVVEREIAMTSGRAAVAVRHRLVRAPTAVRLEVAALGGWRDAHGDTHAGAAPDPRTGFVSAGAVVENSWRISGPGFQPAGQWYRGVRYREESARGLTDVEDLWHVGTFTAQLQPGDALDVLAWAADAQGLSVPPPPAAEVVLAAGSRARALLATAGLPVAPDGDRLVAARQLLVLAADQHITGGPGVVAGYPWFGEWSRDTLTSYEGLFLCTGRHAEGAALLRRCAATLSAGMLANTADGGLAQYNTVDASPWFLVAAGRHLAVTDDLDLAAGLAPALLGIVDAYLAGTRYGIGVDPTDGLVRCGAGADPAQTAALALTWMDARVDGRPVTPRHGKPVEVNALWVAGLGGVGELLARTGAPAADVARMRRLQRTALMSFRARFLDTDGSRTGRAGGLLDVVDAPGADGGLVDDASLRPNQLLAVSLPGGPLADRAGAVGVLGAVGPLVTPLGPRSLAQGAPGYLGRHRGTPAQRDAAYHQGTVWPWLTGPYVAASHLAGRSSEPALIGLLGHLREAGLGSVSETADGDAPHGPTGCPFQAWSVGQLLAALTPDPGPR